MGKIKGSHSGKRNGGGRGGEVCLFVNLPLALPSSGGEASSRATIPALPGTHMPRRRKRERLPAANSGPIGERWRSRVAKGVMKGAPTFEKGIPQGEGTGVGHILCR